MSGRVIDAGAVLLSWWPKPLWRRSESGGVSGDECGKESWNRFDQKPCTIQSYRGPLGLLLLLTDPRELS